MPDQLPNDDSPSAEEMEQRLAKFQSAEKKTRKHYDIIAQLQQLKLQTQALDMALIKVAQNEEVGLDYLLPACIHLDKLQMELLKEIKRQSEITRDLEKMSSWYVKRYNLDVENMLAQPESHGDETE